MATEIATRHPLSIIYDEGNILDVDGSGMGCLSTKYDWEDLGVEMPRKGARLILKPPAYTLPSEYAMQFFGAVQGGRDAFYHWAQPQGAVSDAFGPGWRWLPWTAQSRFDAQWEHAQERLVFAKASVRDNRAEIQSEVESIVGEIARNAETSLNAVRGTEVPWNFRSRVIGFALDRIPSIDQLEAITLTYKQPSASAMASFRDRTVVTRRPMTDEEIKQYAVEEIAKVEVESRREMASLEREAKQRQIEIRLQAEREFVQREFDPLHEAMSYVRGELVQNVRELLGTIERQGTLPGASVVKITGMLEWFQASNVARDGEMAGLLDKLQGYALQGKKRSTEAVVATLAEMVSISKDAVIEASKSNRMARLMVAKKGT
jgi:hypothetical protein